MPSACLVRMHCQWRFASLARQTKGRFYTKALISQSSSFDASPSSFFIFKNDVAVCSVMRTMAAVLHAWADLKLFAIPTDLSDQNALGKVKRGHPVSRCNILLSVANICGVVAQNCAT